jgi:hypothetical protein
VTDREIDRAASLVRQYPIEHPPKLDRWPYAPVPRQQPPSLAESLAVVAVILLLFIATGLLT